MNMSRSLDIIQLEKQIISFVTFQFFQLVIVACGSPSQDLVTINLHVIAMTSILIYVR